MWPGFIKEIRDALLSLATALADPTTGTPWGIVGTTTALAKSLVIKSSAGRLRSITGRIDALAPQADYFIQVLVAASLPTDGVVTHLVPPTKLAHKLGTDDYFALDYLENGLAFTTGCVVAISTNEFQLALLGSGNYLSATARRL